MAETQRPTDGGGLPCPACGSPLRPCRCQREAGKRRVRRRNSTLTANPEKKLRTRTLRERYAEDPFRYGPVFETVRELGCFGQAYLPGHQCGLGYAPATAHHLGHDDLDGLLPACGSLHDELESRPWEVEKELEGAGSPTLRILGSDYVRLAIEHLRQQGALDPEIEAAAARRPDLSEPEGDRNR